jgi:hypothetical protein
VKPEFAAVEEEAFLPSNFCALFNFLFDRGTRPKLSPDRAGHNWMPDEFAKSCGVEPRTVNNWRSGRTLPFRDALIDIEEAFFGDVKDNDPYKQWRLRLRRAHTAAGRARKAHAPGRLDFEPVATNPSNQSPDSGASHEPTQILMAFPDRSTLQLPARAGPNPQLPSHPAPLHVVEKLNRLRSMIDEAAPRTAELEARQNEMRRLIHDVEQRLHVPDTVDFIFDERITDASDTLLSEFIRDEVNHLVSSADLAKPMFYCIDTTFERVGVDVWKDNPHYKRLTNASREAAMRAGATGDFLRIEILSQPDTFLKSAFGIVLQAAP